MSVWVQVAYLWGGDLREQEWGEDNETEKGEGPVWGHDGPDSPGLLGPDLTWALRFLPASEGQQMGIYHPIPSSWHYLRKYNPSHVCAALCSIIALLVSEKAWRSKVERDCRLHPVSAWELSVPAAAKIREAPTARVTGLQKHLWHPLIYWSTY